MSKLTDLKEWKNLIAHRNEFENFSILQAFEENPNRVAQLSMEGAGISLDISKNLITTTTINIITMIIITMIMIIMGMIMAKERIAMQVLECRLLSSMLSVLFDLHSRYDYECWSRHQCPCYLPGWQPWRIP